MNDDPCKNAYDEFFEALEEMQKAETRVRRFFLPSTKPLDPMKDVEPQNVDLEEWREASDLRNEANRNFKEKNDAYFECRKQHGFPK